MAADKSIEKLKMEQENQKEKNQSEVSKEQNEPLYIPGALQR